MKKLNIILALVALMMGGTSDAVDVYSVPAQDKPVFKLDVYNQGETFKQGTSSITSTYTLDENSINTILDTSNDLVNALGLANSNFETPISMAVITQNISNAYSQTMYAYNIGQYKIPYTQALLLNIASDYSVVPSIIVVGLGVIDSNPGWATINEKKPLYSGEKPYMYSVIYHELLHSAGIISGAGTYSSSTTDYSFSAGPADEIMLWDAFLRINKNGVEVAPQPGMHIKYNANTSGEFDIYNNSPYFVGENTLKALTGTTDKSVAEMKQILKDNGGLKNYSKYYDNLPEKPIVYGLPVHPTDQSGPELSHTELRNSFMSHQNYRNWLMPMEAEYAVLKDLGYKVEPRAYFGKSYYLNNVTDNFDTGYSKWDEQSQTYTQDPSTVAYGTGLHIYGDNNNITQTSNVSSTGVGTIGARIEGVGNTYSLTNGKSINVTGDNSSAVAVTWGKNHTINLDQGTTISASGNNGIGANFNFGSGILGDYYVKKGSYIYSIYYDTDDSIHQLVPDIETQGALVSDFNVRGNIYGKQAAIYIADNAFVRNINILNGANIQGNIVSDWNSISSGNYSKVLFKVDDEWYYADPDNGYGYFTNLNFGTNDEAYIGSYSYDISGDNGIYNTLKMSVSPNSSLTLNGSNVAVYSIDNKGTINVESNVNFSTQNYGITGTGTMNAGKGSVITLSDKVKNVDNTVNVLKGGTISTANDVESDHTFNKLVTADSSKISFDIGDTMKIVDNEGSAGTSKFSSIKISSDQLSDLVNQGLDYQKILFDSDGQIINMGNNYFNVYKDDKKYVFIQDPDNPNIIKVNAILDADAGIKEAAEDPSTGNYIVEDGEIQEHEGGTVNGDSFEITGSDLNFGENNGLIIDGSLNENGTTVKVSTYNASANDTYKGTYTVQNGGILIVENDDSDIEIKNTINTDRENSAIYIDSTSRADLNSYDNNKITISGKIQGESGAIVNTSGSRVNLYEVDSVTVNQNANNLSLNGLSTNTAWQLQQGYMNVAKDAYLSSNGTNSVQLNGGTLNLQNGSANTINLASMNVNSNSNVLVDLDFANNSIDRFSFPSPDNLQLDDVTLNISNINMINSDKVNSDAYRINFVDPSLNNTNFLGKVTANIPNIMTPIYKYNAKYEENGDTGSIVFTTPAGKDEYDSYNPAVMTTSVAAQVGGYLNQLVTYDMAFSNMDMIMNYPEAQRTALLMRNRYAASDDTLMKYDPNQLPDFHRGLWIKPYTSFDKVKLKHGPKVNNINYGSFIGGDSDTHELKHGWNAMYSGYIGYQGARQSYNSITSYQDGVNLGLSGFLYHKHFFTGLTSNFGIGVATAGTMYGRDEYAILGTGAAWKSGYNFEFKDGRYIIQPNYLMSYTMINSTNYTNAAGVKIKSDPLNSLQLAPGMKLIMNTKNGWQPYLAAQMIWNVFGNNRVKANGVVLPELSIKPYIQYGVGAKKTITDIFTFYGQTMVRNMGRTGVELSLGMKWAVGLRKN